MIRVRYYPQEPRLYVSGHAGYAPAGEDIVCAGISALYCTLRGHEGVDETQGRYTAANELRCALTAELGREKELKPLFDTIANGMEDIAQKYPEYVEYSAEDGK